MKYNGTICKSTNNWRDNGAKTLLLGKDDEIHIIPFKM